MRKEEYMKVATKIEYIKRKSEKEISSPICRDSSLLFMFVVFSNPKKVEKAFIVCDEFSPLL